MNADSGELRTSVLLGSGRHEVLVRAANGNFVTDSALTIVILTVAEKQNIPSFSQLTYR